MQFFLAAAGLQGERAESLPLQSVPAAFGGARKLARAGLVRAGRNNIKRRIEHLFVYGTLRAAARHPLQRELRRHARWLGPGQVAGRLYDLGRYPGLVPDAKAGAVQGDVYRLRHARVLLRRLDRYEACAPRMPQPREYRREPVSVWYRGRRLWAWAYVYNRSVAGLRTVPGGDYLERPHAGQARRQGGA